MNSVGKFLVAAALSVGLSACAQPGGAVREIGAPISSAYVQIVSVSEAMVEIESSGRLVRAAPPKGLCIPADSIQTSGEAAFLLMDGCAGGAGDGDLSGVMSLSVSAAPLALSPEGLERLFRSDDGLAGLGMGGGATDVTLIDAAIEGDAVIAMVEDRSGAGPAFAGNVICRAFTELNGRMAVVTLISRRETPQAPDEMRRDLVRVVDALRAANA